MVIYRLDPFQNIVNVHWANPSEPPSEPPLEGPWTIGVLLRCPLDPRMMEGTLTGPPWGGSGLAPSDDGVEFSGSFDGGEANWTYNINDFIEFPGGLPGAERFTIEITLTAILTDAPPGTNFFVGQMNESNYAVDAPHGGSFYFDTVTRTFEIDGEPIPVFSVP